MAALLGVGVVLSPVLDRPTGPSAAEAAAGSIARPSAIPATSMAVPRPVVANGAGPARALALAGLRGVAPLEPRVIGARAPEPTRVVAPPEVVEGAALARFTGVADRGIGLVATADGGLAVGATGGLALDGRPVVVHLAASWCGPCADELATFAALARVVPRAVLVMAEDVGGPAGLAAAAEALADRAEPSSRAWPRGLELRADPDWAWAAWLGREALPVTAVIDAQGALRLVASGPLDADAAARVAMLAEAP